MTACNAKADDKTGDDRKAFMKTCLSAKPAAPAKPESKMAMCNKQTAGLSGDGGGDGVGGRDQRDGPARRRLAQARAHVRVGTHRQSGAELIGGAAGHRVAGDHVLRHRLLDEARRRQVTRPASTSSCSTTPRTPPK